MSGLQKFGFAIVVIVNIFCSDEMVPGWGMFHLDWPPQTFYLIAAIGSAIGGAILGGRYALPGLIGGAFVGYGALFTMEHYLRTVTQTNSGIEFFVAAGGAIPGIILGFLFVGLQRLILPAPATQTSQTVEAAPPAPINPPR